MFVLLNNLKNWLNVFVTESKQLLWRRKLSTDTKPVSVSGCKHDYFFKGWTWQAALASVQDADWMLLSRLISRYLSLCGAFVQSVELLIQMCSPQAAKSLTVGVKVLVLESRNQSEVTKRFVYGSHFCYQGFVLFSFFKFTFHNIEFHQ